MVDEFIRKQDAVDMCGGYGCLAHLMSIIKPADVVPICQTGCKGCKREYNLVVGSCSLCARFYKDMYEGIE